MCFCAIFRNKCFEVQNQLTKDNEEFDEAPDVALDIFPEKGVLLEREAYMQKTCDVAEKAILAKKNCGKSA